MAKQMKRIEKRYVPQQESFRNLPNLRPAADPVLAAETPVVDPASAKLKEMADAFSGINKALKDFYTMEKSFEETNRRANQTRGRLGLAPLEGPGFLDYGVTYGYQEGRGMATATEAIAQIQQELATADHFVDLENPNREATLRQLNDYMTQKVHALTGAELQNNAFLEGALRPLAELKVQETVVAMEKLQAAEQQVAMRNFSTWAKGDFMKRLPEFMGNPLGLRDHISSLLKEAPRFNLNKDAAAEVLVLSTLDDLQSLYVEAFNKPSAEESVPAMESVAKLMSNFVNAASMQDSSGVPLGGFSGGAGGSKVTPLKQTIAQLKSAHRDMVSELDRMGKLRKEERKIKQQNTVIVDMVDHRLTKEQILDKYRHLQTSDPELLSVVLKTAVDTETAWNTEDNPALVRKLITDRASTATIEQHLAVGNLSKADYGQLMTVWANRRSSIQFAQAQEAYRNSKFSGEQAKAEKEQAEANVSMVYDYIVANRMIQDASLKSQMLDMAKLGKPMTTADLDNIAKSYTDRRTMDGKQAEITSRNEATAAATAIAMGKESVPPAVSTMAKTATQELDVDFFSEAYTKLDTTKSAAEVEKERRAKISEEVSNLAINIPEVTEIFKGSYKEALTDYIMKTQDLTVLSTVQRELDTYIGRRKQFELNNAAMATSRPDDYQKSLRELRSDLILKLPNVPPSVIDRALEE